MTRSEILLNSAWTLLLTWFCSHSLFVKWWKPIASLHRSLHDQDAEIPQSAGIFTCHSWRECGHRRRSIERAEEDLEAREGTQALCPEYNGFKDRGQNRCRWNERGPQAQNVRFKAISLMWKVILASAHTERREANLSSSKPCRKVSGPQT